MLETRFELLLSWFVYAVWVACNTQVATAQERPSKNQDVQCWTLDAILDRFWKDAGSMLVPLCMHKWYENGSRNIA